SLKTSVCLILALIFGSLPAFAQGPTKLRNEQPPIPTDEIIRKFAEREKEFKTARANYVYRQDNSVQTLNANDRVTGEWRQVWDITFDPSGKRLERVTLAPPNTLTSISLSPEDLQDMREIQPFVLTSDDVGKYSVKYI